MTYFVLHTFVSCLAKLRSCINMSNYFHVYLAISKKFSESIEIIIMIVQAKNDSLSPKADLQDNRLNLCNIFPAL